MSLQTNVWLVLSGHSGMVFEVALYTMMLAPVAITKDKTSLLSSLPTNQLTSANPVLTEMLWLLCHLKTRIELSLHG